jgi:hypothetical protein
MGDLKTWACTCRTRPLESKYPSVYFSLNLRRMVFDQEKFEETNREQNSFNYWFILGHWCLQRQAISQPWLECGSDHAQPGQQQAICRHAKRPGCQA